MRAININRLISLEEAIRGGFWYQPVVAFIKKDGTVVVTGSTFKRRKFSNEKKARKVITKDIFDCIWIDKKKQDKIQKYSLDWAGK